MILRARSQHDDVANVATPSEHEDNKDDELTNNVSVRVPPSSLTGNRSSVVSLKFL